jgi:hypothetical protein
MGEEKEPVAATPPQAGRRVADRGKPGSGPSPRNNAHRPSSLDAHADRQVQRRLAQASTPAPGISSARPSPCTADTSTLRTLHITHGSRCAHIHLTHDARLYRHPTPAEHSYRCPHRASPSHPSAETSVSHLRSQWAAASHSDHALRSATNKRKR